MSMSSAVATPDSTSRTASMASAEISRVVTKPGDVAVDDDAGLADRSANARAAASVSSLVL